jgi:hypothetical protein
MSILLQLSLKNIYLTHIFNLRRLGRTIKGKLTINTANSTKKSGFENPQLKKTPGCYKTVLFTDYTVKTDYKNRHEKN